MGDESRQRAPQKQQQPHQRSSIGGTWLSTFILGVDESSLRPSITHRHGEEREKRGWFAKYKLTTNWSAYSCLLLFFFLLLTDFHSYVLEAMYCGCSCNSSVSKPLQIQRPIGPLPPAAVTRQTVKQCDRLVTFPGCILPLAQSNYIQWWAFYPEILLVSE